MKKIISIIFVFVLLVEYNVFNDCRATVTRKTVLTAPVLVTRQGIKVYIPKKDMLSTTMQHAFMDWQKHTSNNFTFEFVGTKSTANMEVIFVESGISGICRNGDALGCTTYHRARTVYGNQKILGAKIYISMLDNNNKPMTKNQVYTIMLHEIGHALGLGHSNDKNSLMYVGTNHEMAEGQEIQPEDIKQLYNLYGIN